ncbi:MAG: glycosyltransferase family 4 protein [Candidatus Sumerlaeaceae bacterium]
MSQRENIIDGREQPSIIYLLKMFPRFSETFILNEILGLEELGFRVHIYSLKKPNDGKFHAQLGRLKAKVRYVPEYVLYAPGQCAGAWWHMVRRRPAVVLSTFLEALFALNIYALKRWIQALWLARELEGDSQIGVHCHFALSAPRVAYFLKKLNGNSFTFTAHAKDIYLRNTKAGLLRRKILASRGVVTVCDYNLKYLASKHAAGLETKIQRIYNGVDLDSFSPPAFDTRLPNRILSVSRLVEKKGLDVLLRACAILKERGISFECRIVGDGECSRSLHQLTKELQLNEHVHFTGALAQERVQEELRQCALITAPCLEASDGNLDALPTSLLEALATGTPILSTTVTGIPEIVTSGEQGLLVKPNSPAELADAIESLFKNPELRRAMSQSGRLRAEQRFDRKQANRLLAQFLLRAHGTGERSRMHVGYVLTVFPRLSETFILRELRELERLGARLTVFSQKRPIERKVHAEAADLRARVVYLSPWWRCAWSVGAAHIGFLFSRNCGYRAAFNFVRSRPNVPNLKKFWRAARIAREAQRAEIQLLHCHFLSSNTRLGRLAAQISGLPYSVTAHAKDIYASGMSDREMARRLEEAACVVTISHANQQFLAGKAPRGHIEMIPNSIDLADFSYSPHGFDQQQPLHILAVGRLVPKKGFHVLVDALQELRNRGINFEARIAGDGEDRARLQQLIESRSLTANVFLTGAKTQDELRQDYAWTNVLVVPSVQAEGGDVDGVPVVLLEAMALGVPVIASRISGIPELVIDGDTGVLVEPAQPAQLAKALEDLSSRDLSGLTQRARNFLERNHDIHSTCTRLLTLMEQSAGAAA